MSTPHQPRHDTPTGAVALSTATPGAAADSTVIVVDDMPANVALLERLLGAAGVGRVHGFTDPELAELARGSVRASRATRDTRTRLLAGIDAWLRDGEAA